MKALKQTKLLKILILLVDILLFLVIIRECKVTSFCLTIFNLISPIIIGFGISWLIKPIMNYFNKKFSKLLSTIITYSILLIIVALFGYFLIPIRIEEIVNIILIIMDFYSNLPINIRSKIDIPKISYKIINVTVSVKDAIINLFYSFFISYYFLIDNKKITKWISKYTPAKLINEISSNLKLFVRGTIYDTVILFILTITSFKIAGMPNSLLFASLISITNIIPFIGPYIGGIPSALMAFLVDRTLGIIITIIIVVLQFIESSFIHPIIMSKSMNIHPILVLISLIVFGHFFGIIGMVISTPLISIIKSLYMYYKPFKQLRQKLFY